MQKKLLCPLMFITLTLAVLTGCGLSSNYDHLKDIQITVDGDPGEWTPFPIVHNDPEGDNISIEYDISTIKAFSNNETGFMYMLVESYIPVQEITTLEVDLQYGEETYRLGFIPGKPIPGMLAQKTDEDQWEYKKDLLGSQFAAGEAIEISFPMDSFPTPENLKIAGLRIMGGICCNQYEYYPIDAIRPGETIE